MILRLKEDSLSEKAKKEKVLREAAYPYETLHKGAGERGKFLPEAPRDFFDHKKDTNSFTEAVDRLRRHYLENLNSFDPRARNKVLEMVQELGLISQPHQLARVLRGDILGSIDEYTHKEDPEYDGNKSAAAALLGRWLPSPVTGFVSGMWPTPAYKVGGLVKRKRKKFKG